MGTTRRDRDRESGSSQQAPPNPSDTASPRRLYIFIVALETMVDRLTEDHATAKRLAEGLHRIDASLVNPHEVETNLVRVDVSGSGKKSRSAAQWSAELEHKGARVSPASTIMLRFVTHRHISDADVVAAVSAVASLWKNS